MMILKVDEINIVIKMIGKKLNIEVLGVTNKYIINNA